MSPITIISIVVGTMLAIMWAGGVYGAERGVASRYDRSSGARVACGGALNEGALTAAHRTLACGTRVRVMDPVSRRSVVVTINDRGPFVRGRIIDLTPAAAESIGLTRSRGLVSVEIEPER